MPEDISYFNAAYMGPRLHSVSEAGQTGLRNCAQPWRIHPEHFFDGVEKARALFAQLLGSEADNIALMPSVSYAVETAINNLTLKSGDSVIVLEGQFPSNIYPWRRAVRRFEASLVTVPRPSNGDWTAAVLEHMSDQVAVAAIPHCHWTDGAKLDLAAISGACKAHGTALVIDATQSLGAMPLNLAAVAPDFLVAASYKWLLGPYSLAFCYIAPTHHQGEPLEENWVNRENSQNFARLVDYRDSYLPGARRFDFGERNNPILVPMAITAFTQILSWSVEEIAAALEPMVDQLAEMGETYGYTPTPKPVRSPHMLGLSRGGGLPHNLATSFATKNIDASIRGSSIRLAPHLHINDMDIARLKEVLANS